jgi:membrane-bound lytic murein transglycosylase A
VSEKIFNIFNMLINFQAQWGFRRYCFTKSIKMKNYWIAFTLSLTLLGTAFKYHQNLKNGNKQQTALKLDSLVPNIENIKAIEVSEKKVSVKAHKLSKLYTKVNIDTFKLPKINEQFLKALEYQKVFLSHAQDDKFDNLRVEVDQLEDVLDIFRKAKSSTDLSKALDAYQIYGMNEEGDVKMTGYYSPVIAARHSPDAVYKFPIYLSKSDESSTIINEKKRTAKENMKVVYVRDRHDIYSMRIEGTAFLQFPEGDRQVVAFEGDYNLPNSESGDHDKNGSTTYTIFTEKDKPRPVGAAKVPLTNDYTIAVDKSYIPLGSVLLAEIPILDENGNQVRTEFRFVLAQDTGGAIDGAGHIDLYMGEGDTGKKRIHFMNKTGKLWLLLPRDNEKKLVAQSF